MQQSASGAAGGSPPGRQGGLEGLSKADQKSLMDLANRTFLLDAVGAIEAFWAELCNGSSPLGKSPWLGWAVLARLPIGRSGSDLTPPDRWSVSGESLSLSASACILLTQGKYHLPHEFLMEIKGETPWQALVRCQGLGNSPLVSLRRTVTGTVTCECTGHR